MFGLNDFWIASAYLLCILSTLLCVVYGLVNWNKGGEEPKAEIKKDDHWEESERQMEDNL